MPQHLVQVPPPSVAVPAGHNHGRGLFHLCLVIARRPQPPSLLRMLHHNKAPGLQVIPARRMQAGIQDLPQVACRHRLPRESSASTAAPVSPAPGTFHLSSPSSLQVVPVFATAAAVSFWSSCRDPQLTGRSTTNGLPLHQPPTSAITNTFWNPLHATPDATLSSARCRGHVPLRRCVSRSPHASA